MSANYKLLNRPPQWVSAHRKCEFKYAIKPEVEIAILDDSGYVRLITFISIGVSVGDRVFLRGGVYNGFHTVKSIAGSNDFTLNTAYTVAETDIVTVTKIILPTVKLYSGFNEGEILLPVYPSGTVDLFTIYPYKLAGTFKPEISADGYVYFNIQGYLKTIIDAPYKVGYNESEENYNYKIYPFAYWIPKTHNRIRIVIEGNNECDLKVANASISVEELNRYYVNTRKQLQPTDVVFKLGGVLSIGDYINGGILIAKIT